MKTKNKTILNERTGKRKKIMNKTAHESGPQKRPIKRREITSLEIEKADSLVAAQVLRYKLEQPRNRVGPGNIVTPGRPFDGVGQTPFCDMLPYARPSYE